MDNRKTNAKKDCCALCGETKAVPGDAVITSYNVFPGINLAFYSVHMDCFVTGVEKKGEFYGNPSLP